ncbi:MAG: hypothetical protein V1907_01970 [Candidatus Kerfeldbacteria bacterium]
MSSNPLLAEVGWKDNGQCGMPSGSLACMVGAPINTSASTQTKTGPLTLENGLTISNPDGRHCSGDISVPCSGANQQLANKVCVVENAGNVCLSAADLLIFGGTDSGGLEWNGVTKRRWSDIDLAQGNFVTIRTEGYDPSFDQTGYISVKGPDAAVGRIIAVGATAGPPAENAPTAGIFAHDNYSSRFPSYAVNARTGTNGGSSNIAVYAYTTTNAKLSWAAYFRGNVIVDSPYDVIVSGTAPPNSGPPANNTLAELCIGDECHQTWPGPGSGDDLWVDSSGFLQVRDATWQLAIGGNDANAPFIITPVPSQVEANLTVRGFGSSSSLTIE